MAVSGCGRRSAFTFLEILLVIIIVVAITAMAVPSFSDATKGEQLPESAYRVKALIAMCRAEAMNQARRFRITFRADGNVRVYAQEDALLAPQSFLPVEAEWARGPFLLDNTWVEAVQALPSGPAPVLVEDDAIEFTTIEEEPVSVTEVEKPLQIHFEPDGSSGSARWVLRDAAGRGSLMTLDGRLGRVQVEHWPSVDAKSLERPPPIEDEEEPVPVLGSPKAGMGATRTAGGHKK
jgi:Tfp pilus assembly protein FimT